MQRSHDAHVQFKKAWNEWWGPGRTERWPEPATVIDARNAFHAAQDALFDKYLMPIDTSLRNGDASCIDDAITVLAVDVHAFRVGYLKAMWLRRIKRLPLTVAQQEHLREISLGKLTARVAGREMVEWNRLLSKIATDDDVTLVTALTEHPDKRIQWRARTTLRSIVGNRPKLRRR